MKTTLALLLLAATVGIAGCARSEADQTAATSLSFQVIENPAAPGSGEPNLHTSADGDVFLSWVEPGKAERVLRVDARFDPAQEDVAGGRGVQVRLAAARSCRVFDFLK